MRKDTDEMADAVLERINDEHPLTAADVQLIAIALNAELNMRGTAALIELDRLTASGAYWRKCKCGSAFVPRGQEHMTVQCGSITEVHYVDSTCFSGSF